MYIIYNLSFFSQPHKHVQFISLKESNISTLYPDEVPINATNGMILFEVFGLLTQI